METLKMNSLSATKKYSRQTQVIYPDDLMSFRTASQLNKDQLEELPIVI